MLKSIRASPTENVILSYFTISKNYFIRYTVLFYNTLNISKFYFFPILFKYSFLFFFLLFLFFYSFSSLSSSTSSTSLNTQSHTHTQTHDTLIHLSKPITTHTHTNTSNHSFETNFFILEKPRQKRLRIKIHKFHFLYVLPQLSRKPNSSQRKI